MKKELLRYQRLAGIITESKYNSMLQENEMSAIGQKVEDAVENELKAKVDALSDEQKDQLRAELAKLGVTADSEIKDVASKLDESLLEGEGDVKRKVADILGGVGQTLIGSLLVPFLPIYIGSLDPVNIGMVGGLAIVSAVGGGLIGLAKLLGAEDSKPTSKMEENSSMLNENDFNQDMFEEMADRIDSEVLDEVGEGDDAQIGRVTSERIEMELEEKYPNRKISVTYTPYNTGRHYSAFDQNEEEIIADYTV